jgi:hypothetical protein
MTYVLCRFYHCRPSELRQERLSTLLEQLVCAEMDAKLNKPEAYG